MEEILRHFVYGDYFRAIGEFSELLKSQPENSNLLLYRGITYIKTGQYDLAIKDLEKSDKYKSDNFQANFHRGIALFYKEKYSDALEAFKIAEVLAMNNCERIPLSEWTQKCLCELKSSSPAKLNEVATMPKSEELKKVTEYDWYQNATHVIMELRVKNCPKEALTVVFKPQELEISIKLHENKAREYLYKLNGKIVPSECSYTIDEKKVECKMKKEDGLHWSSFEKEEKTEFRPSYPSSAKKKVDWDKFDKQVEKEIAKDKPEGDEALNNLFKAIYE